MRWYRSHRYDPRALPLADRHYNRRTIGAPQFVPPGRNIVLLTESADALWVTSFPFAAYVKHRWAGAWVCSLFRNESTALSSELIVEAMAATVHAFDTPPRCPSWIVVERGPHASKIERAEIAMVTFVDDSKTRSKRDPGRCFRRAGLEDAGRSVKGLVALVLRTDRVPPPCAPLERQANLFALFGGS